MRTLIIAVVVLMLACIFSSASVLGQQQEEKDHSCAYCGMDRQKFAHTAMMIEYEDGKVVGACSIHCAAVDLAVNIDKTPKSIQVGDFNTKKQINAEAACWTLGGDVQGVMTKRAKWAFENTADCEKFAKEHGANIVSFDEAMKAAYEDMYSDTKMIRDKRKAAKEHATGQRRSE